MSDGTSIEVLVNSSKSCAAKSAAFIWAHSGGGFAMSASQHNELMIRWAHKYNCIVFNVDYRLAPETPTPGG